MQWNGGIESNPSRYFQFILGDFLKKVAISISLKYFKIEILLLGGAKYQFQLHYTYTRTHVLAIFQKAIFLQKGIHPHFVRVESLVILHTYLPRKLQQTMDDDESSTSSSTEHQQNGIEVFLRIRASNTPSNYFQQDIIDESQFIFNVPKRNNADDNASGNSAIVAGPDNSRSRYTFKFNSILDSKSKQDDVFQKLGAPAVKNVLDGYNSTLFAYGQTGSGKTYTITGGPERYSDRGIIPRAISMLFASFQVQEQTGQASFTCYISYLELYNESGYDLLAADANGNSADVEVSRLEDMPKVTMLEDEDGNYHFRNLSVNQVHTEEEALNMLFLGDTNRAIGESELNQSSSRSHCIFTIMIEKRLHDSDSVIRSKLNLVDLAGSERVAKTNSTGQSLKEAQYINTSLFFLEMVIVALHEKTKKNKENTHVPYRNSLMTSVLRDSLGGNCKTVMVATISPEAQQTDESMSTCHFAQRVALVKNKARVNEEVEPEVVIRKLKAELKRVREEVKFLKGENGEGEDGLSKEEIEELADCVHSFLVKKQGGEHVGLDIGVMSLSKIQATFAIFKDLHKSQVENNDKECSRDDHGDDEIKTMRNQVRSLQRTVQQRDDEIKTLIEMVKKGGGDISMYENRALQDDAKNRTVQASPRNAPSSIIKQNVHRARSASAKVCGVDRCLDRFILRDPSKAFTWFRQRYPGEKSVAENKSLLQARFQEAKDEGSAVKNCKEQINVQRTQIENIRREVAMEQVLGTNLDDSTGTHPDELKCLSIIEDNKRKYKAGLEHLRELKGAIEHIKKLMEKNQRKMQTDFDTWYAKMYELVESQPETPVQVQQGSSSSADNVDTIVKIVREPAQMQDTCYVPVAQIQTSKVVNTLPKTKTLPSGSLSSSSSSSSTFKMPPGIRLTGNKEADEDIIAFYKAKEALMARTKSRSSVLL
jgi:kinesin family protein 6/9